jgi:Rrf2 family protein
MTGNSRFAVSVHILAYLTYRRDAAVSSAEIAASVDTNAVVIRRLLSAMLKARLVTAQKGAAGGFALAKAPEKISLRDVYHAVDPTPSYGLKRFSPNHDCPVGAKISAILSTAFAKAQEAMEAELAATSIAEVHAKLHVVCPGKR